MIRKLRKIIFGIYFLIGVLKYSDLLAQTQNTSNIEALKTVAPPSPNSSSLGKYADWPVSLYTGVPSINIPIYTIPGRSINIPISLNYHSSGIKVGEIASWVGLGWSLDAGGVITRSVRGLPDDDYFDGYLANRTLYNNPGDMSSGTNPPNVDSLIKVYSARGITDAEPDIYMFNAMGRSYKLYFSGDGTIMTQPYSKIKFTSDWANSSWKVILEDGTILNFGSTGFFETTSTNRFAGTGITQFISSWYLKSIVTSVGEIINLAYTSSSVVQRNYSSKANYMLNDPGSNPAIPCSCDPTPLVDKTRNEVQTVVALQLSAIENELCRVDFIQDTTERKDLQGGKSLSLIKVFSKNKNDYIAQYKLNYHFTQAITPGTPTDYNRFRLRLDSLNQLSPANIVLNTWKFEYNQQNLPSRSSYAQDHFGYFNGATNNTTLLPEIITSAARHDHGFGPDHYVTADRTAQPAYMQAEMLTKIIYPAKGYTQFEYEPNHYLNTEEAFIPGTISQQVEAYTGINPFVFIRTDTLFIKRKQYIKLSTYAYISPSFLQDHPNPNIHCNIKTLSGTNVGGAAMVNNQSLTVYNFLDSGTYICETRVTGVTAADFVAPTDYLILTTDVFYKKGIGIQSLQKLVGGLRIKKQQIFDNITSTPQIINYEYSSPLVIAPLDTINSYLTTLFDETKVWSWTYGPEGIVWHCWYYAGDVESQNCFQEYLVRHSTTKEALGSIQGGPIGYGQVKLTYGNNGENGYTISKFYNENDDEGTNEAKEFPYPAVCGTDWRRGLLLEQSTYTNSNQRINRTTNQYQFVYKNSIFGFKTGFLYQRHAIVDNTTLNDLAIRDVKLKTEVIQSLTSISVAYNPQTGDSLVTTTNYFYDNPSNLSPVRTETTDSKGNIIKSISRGPLEKADINAATPLTSTASAAIDTMLARNIISPVLQQEQYKAGVLQSRSLTNYKNWTSTILQPENVQLQIKNNPLETRVQFTGYDPYSNLVQQKKANDITHSYIWDYLKNFPIAECTGTDSVNIAYTSFESDGKGYWSFSSAATADATAPTGKKAYSLTGSNNITRTGLNSATTYIVSYWTKNSSAFSITGTISGYPVQGRTVNGWNYFEHKITGQTQVSIGGNGMIDEARLYPDKTLMTTYTYDPLIGMTSQCDANNRISYYEYDAFNRLSLVRDQDKKVVKKICYNYAGQPENCQSGCTNISPDWQNTNTQPTCQQGSCGNTGYQLQEQRDMNPCSATYNQTQTVTVYNPGACPSTGVNITAQNFVNVSGFTAVYTNLSTNQTYTFTIPASGSVTLGCIPAGTYSLSISKPGNFMYTGFDIGCMFVSGTSAYFASVNVTSTTCNYIIIGVID